MLKLVISRLLLVVIAALFMFPAVVQAGEWRAYDAAAFQKALANGEPVFVSVHADW